MSQLAQNWIETNFNLPKKILNLEKSFSNGFLFLKILENKNLLEEEDINNINDSDIPTIILKNMNILTRRLKLININLSKQQIADIISEQPGSAADLIMSLKKKFEGISTSPRWRNTAYKNAIRSLNPKTTTKKLEGETQQDTQFLSTLVGKGSHFKEIDAYAQQKKYFDFDHDEEQRYKERLDRDHHSKLNSVTERRQNFLETLDNRIQKRIETTTIGTKNWKTNELTKKKRLTRHLQYELAVSAQLDLKYINENNKFRNDQEYGIEEFENNLKRNGLGGDDTNNGEVMLPTTEDSLMYLNRIEEKVQNNWPSNGEIGDFMQNLEKRTRELRLARQEKARRKRRLQVEQKAALLEIGGSSAPVSRSTSFDASSLMSETPQQKLERKQREYEEITEKAKLQRQEQAEEGERRVKIFAERQRMIAFENNTWLNRKEEVLAAQAIRLKEKKLRNYTTCKSIVIDLISDLFSIDSNHPSITFNNNNNNNSNSNSNSNININNQQQQDDDIYHTNLIKQLQEIYQKGITNINNNNNINNINSNDIQVLLPVYNQVSRSIIIDLYPSAILLASQISKWKQIQQEQGQYQEQDQEQETQHQFSRISSFRESALDIFQQFRKYSESNEICPFSYDNSSEFISLLNLLTSQQKETGIISQQSIFLITGENHDLPKEILSIICNWLGGQEMISILTITQAVQLGLKLRTYGMVGETFDSTTIKFEHLVEVFNIIVKFDKSQFPELNYQSSRIINDICDIITRILSGNTLLLSSLSPNFNSIELTSFKFSDCTLAILLAQILWLREYTCSIINNITGIPPLTPIILTSLNFGVTDRLIVLKIFDWFLRGGSRTNLPEGDETIQNEINDEIATVPIEKGKKGNKPPAAKNKKDKRDTSEEIKSYSSIKTLFWIQGMLTKEINDITLESKQDSNNINNNNNNTNNILDVIEVYSKILKKKYNNNNNNISNDLEVFTKDLNTYFIKLQNTSNENRNENENNLFSLLHPFNLAEVVISTILNVLKSILTNYSNKMNDTNMDYLLEINNLINEKRQLLSSPQRLWLNHIMKINEIDFNSIRNVLDKLKECSAIELDSLSGLILSLLLKIQSVRTEMFHEKALLSNTFKSTEGQWRETCLEWREFFIETEKLNRKSVDTKNDSIQTLFHSKSRELECELGDLIDYRHQRWTKHIDELNKQLIKYMNQLYITINELTKSVSNNIISIIQHNLNISLELANLLIQAGYKQFPWILKTDLTKAGSSRTDFNRLRDEIRNQYALLNTLINTNRIDIVDDNNNTNTTTIITNVSARTSARTTPIIKQNFDTSVEINNFFSKFDNLSLENENNDSNNDSNLSNTSLKSAVIYELKSEGLEMTISILRTLRECLKSMQGVQLSIVEDLKDYSYKRNQYEHKILREWIGELRKSFLSPSLIESNTSSTTQSIISQSQTQSQTSLSSVVTFMNSYYFGVSDDPEHDGVPRSSLGNKGLVDVGEMVLSIRKIRMLSLELLIGRSQNFHEHSFDPVKFLTSTIQRLSDRSESLPITWRNIKKIENFVESICLSHDFASVSVEQFNIEVVLRLLLGTIPRSIPSTYISRLGKKILEETSSNLNSQSPSIVKLSTILGIISKDKILSVGWWSNLNSSNNSDFQNYLDTIQLIIEIIAFTCALPDTLVIDSKNSSIINSVDIHVDKFLSIMCYGPSLSNESISILQSSLCLTYDSSSDENVLNSFINLKQQYFYESITKLLFIGKKLILDDNNNNNNSDNNSDNKNDNNDNIVEDGVNNNNNNNEMMKLKNDNLYQIVFGPNITQNILKWIQLMNQYNGENNEIILNHNNQLQELESETEILCFNYLQSLSSTGISM